MVKFQGRIRISGGRFLTSIIEFFISPYFTEFSSGRTCKVGVTLAVQQNRC